MNDRCILVAALLLVLLAVPVQAQPADAERSATMTERRPIPYPVTLPANVQQAIANGTRTASGAPGPNYWTNTAHYDIEATLNPASEMLRGEATIRYHNASPDTLRRLLVHLRQNVYRDGVVRNRSVAVTGGMILDRVALNGTTLDAANMQVSDEPMRGDPPVPNAYAVSDTRMAVYPGAPVAPGDTVRLDVAWHFEVPGPNNFRMGQDGETFYLGYWYPQMAVYDDLHGWRAQPYQGDGEFYMPWGTYDVSITVPEGWLVGATGTLQNPDDVLTESVQARLDRAAQTDSIVTVVSEQQRGAGSATVDASDRPTLTWRFHAEDVRDFAFGTSAQYVWDATSAETGDERALVHSLYRPEKTLWTRSAEYAQFSVEHLSDMLIAYPYPQMTVVEGISIGGMEYPMITLIGGDYDAQGLFSVTYHEISHMWIPMVVGTDEKTYAWMDEGLTEFNESEGEDDFYPEMDAWDPANQGSYYRYGGTPNDAPSMRHADRYPVHGPERVYASYSKPRVMLHALRGILGDDTFFAAYRTFVERWAFKHPTPYDLFHTVEDVAERDLDWFWTGAFYEAWALDHSIQDVTSASDGTTVTVADRRNLMMPVLLTATYADGSTVQRRVGVGTWMEGARTAEVPLPAGTVTRVELDPEQFLPDVDRSNNVWTADE